MLNPSVTNERIGATECLFVRANFAADLLLDGIVNGILVTCEIVRPGEYRVARLSGRRVGSHAAVRTRLGVAGSNGGRGGNTVRRRRGLPVSFTAVLLELAGGIETLSAARVCACVGTSVGPGVERLLDHGAGGGVIRIPPRRLLRRRVALHVGTSPGGAVGVVAERIRKAAFASCRDRHAPGFLEVGVLAGRGPA